MPSLLAMDPVSSGGYKCRTASSQPSRSSKGATSRLTWLLVASFAPMETETVHLEGVDGAAHIWASVMDAGVPVDATVGADADADADPLLMTDML